jgi:hypothetical protein
MLHQMVVASSMLLLITQTQQGNATAQGTRLVCEFGVSFGITALTFFMFFVATCVTTLNWKFDTGDKVRTLAF